MSIVDGILGRRVNEMTDTGDIAPVMATPTFVGTTKSTKRRFHLGRKSSVKNKPKTSSIKEDDGGIPDDAEEIDQYAQGSIKSDEVDEVDDFDNFDVTEPLIDASVAIIAPDLTPNAFKPVKSEVIPEPKVQSQQVQGSSHEDSHEDGSDAMDILLNKKQESVMDTSLMNSWSQSYESVGGQSLSPRGTPRNESVDLSQLSASLPAGFSSPLGESSSLYQADQIKQGVRMPDPVQASGKKAFSVMHQLGIV